MIRLLAVLLLCGCAHVSTPEIYSASCVALDLATTQAGLNSGYVEANPIYPKGYEVITATLVALGVHYALRKWDKTAAWYGYGSARCAAGIYNLEVMR